MTKLEFGIKGEGYVARKLDELGIKYWWNPAQSNHYGADFLTEKGVIDVKIAAAQEKTRINRHGEKTIRKRWQFNCHHHGKKQDEIDFFILIVTGYKKEMLYFILPQIKCNRFNIVMSKAQLDYGKFDYFLGNWNLILNGYVEEGLPEIYNCNASIRDHGESKKMLREKLRERILEVYGNQVSCSYALKIENGMLSRIINCNADPTGSQIKKLCNALLLTKKEVLKKHETEETND